MSWNSRKNNKFTNIILVIICIALAVILGSLLLTNRKEVKQESERLEKLSQKQETGIEDYDAVKEHASELKEEADVEVELPFDLIVSDEEDEDAANSSGKEEKAEADRTSSDADETAEDAQASDADKAQSTDKSDTKAGDSDKK